MTYEIYVFANILNFFSLRISCKDKLGEFHDRHATLDAHENLHVVGRERSIPREFSFLSAFLVLKKATVHSGSVSFEQYDTFFRLHAFDPCVRLKIVSRRDDAILKHGSTFNGMME